MRHRAHRRQRADGQAAGAEARRGRTAGQPALEQAGHVGQAELGCAALRRLAHLVELAPQLDVLPGAVGRDVGQSADRVLDRVQPVPDRVPARQAGQGGVEPVDELDQPPGEVNVGGVDVVVGQGAAEQSLLHRHAAEQPVRALAPGALGDAGHLPRRPVPGAEPPPDPAADGPGPQLLQVVVVEPEPLAHGRGAGQVEHLTGRDTAAGELQQGRRDAEQRVRLPGRPVGEGDPQPPAGVRLVAEGGGDERGGRRPRRRGT